MKKIEKIIKLRVFSDRWFESSHEARGTSGGGGADGEGGGWTAVGWGATARWGAAIVRGQMWVSSTSKSRP